LTSATWIDRSLVESPLCIGICFDEGSLERELRRLKVPRADWPGWIDVGKDAHVLTLSNPVGQMVCLVCVEFDDKRDVVEVAGLMTHEAVHVWQAVCEDINEYTPSSEFEAYSIQNISQRLMGAWMAKKKGGKKKGCK
jgi:hypothetical protein